MNSMNIIGDIAVMALTAFIGGVAFGEGMIRLAVYLSGAQ